MPSTQAWDLTATVCLLSLLGSIILSTRAGTLDDGKALKILLEKWHASIPSWSGDGPCRGWEGVLCDKDLRVSSLNLSNQGLVGPLPEELGHLDALVSLDLSNSKHNSGPWNNISGDLVVLEDLKKLLFLNMSSVYLNTRFPYSVLKLTNLRALRLDNAGLIGLLPTKLWSFTKLQYLYLGNNTLEGPLVPEIGNLIELNELSLWGNEINSSIPSELSKLKNLTYLNMHGCDLWGGLPHEFGNLVNLQKLHLYDNRLSGSIPDTWKSLKDLRSLRLEYNYLTKLFPAWTKELQNLKLLDLEHNMLYGTLKDVLPEHVEHLNIKCNYFSGAAPTLLSAAIMEDKGNCFTRANEEDKKRCSQDYYTCSDFSKQVAYGSCTTCPPNQHLINAKTCICEPGSQGAKHMSAMGKAVIIFLVVLGVVGSMLYCMAHGWRTRARFLSSIDSSQEFEMFLYNKHFPDEDGL